MYLEQERRDAERARHAENAARLAQAYWKFDSTGQGAIEFGDRVDFGLTFIEEPFVSFGAQLDLDALGDLLVTDPSETPKMPMVSGFVTAWDQDDRGFYVGAWCAVHVFFPTYTAVAADVAVEMSHHFTFTAIAIKDVPIDVRD